MLQVSGGITKTEIMLAARDILSNKAPDPDLFPSEARKSCQMLHIATERLPTGMPPRGFFSGSRVFSA